VRVLYTLPRAWTDRTLPLTVTPTPQQTVRVMVGRAEVITPAMDTAVQALFQRYLDTTPAGRPQVAAEAGALGLGRFLEPAVKRIAPRVAQSPEAGQLSWEFVTQAARPVAAALPGRSE
jgi:hypothetical protein